MIRKKRKKYIDRSIPQKTIKEILEQSIKGANEFDRELKKVFRLPHRSILLD